MNAFAWKMSLRLHAPNPESSFFVFQLKSSWCLSQVTEMSPTCRRRVKEKGLGLQALHQEPRKLVDLFK